ncbi:MAG: hypothetical protein DME25_07970 [Verrucomicrobia bacterium]|nr:MAG: hypothetical protein DME25_07970 [Verrucomicrobiota bacterium]
MNSIPSLATLGFAPESPWDSRRQSVTYRLAATWIVASLFLLAAPLARAAPWGGFADRSTNLMTFTFSFTGTTNPAAGDSNENYYDGDMGDIDGDGDLDLVCALERDPAGSPHPRVAHAIFINDGNGNFVEETATRFIVAGTNFYAGGNGKLMDVDYDGDLDFFAFDAKTRHFQVYLNDGTGHFTYSAEHSRSFAAQSATTGTGADTDVTDLNRDGSYDVWIGAAGQDPRTLINTYQSPDGLPANLPRNFNIIASTTNGVTLSWQHPAYADVARWYKVYRSTAPGLAPTDRRVIKRVAISRHQDEGPLGSGRAAGADVTDLFFRKDDHAYIAALTPPLSLPVNTLATLTASIADNAGNTRTQTVPFFVSVVAPQLPTASFSSSTTNGLAPLTVEFNGSGSTDSDGKIIRWEWYFGDGSTALGRTVTKTFKSGGAYAVTLLVRDTQGGAGTARRTIAASEVKSQSWNWSGGDFTFSFPTATNRNYVVERANTLSPAGWATLTTVPGNGSVRSVTHTNATAAQQFYRLRTE